MNETFFFLKTTSISLLSFSSLPSLPPSSTPLLSSPFHFPPFVPSRMYKYLWAVGGELSVADLFIEERQRREQEWEERGKTAEIEKIPEGRLKKKEEESHQLKLGVAKGLEDNSTINPRVGKRKKTFLELTVSCLKHVCSTLILFMRSSDARWGTGQSYSVEGKWPRWAMPLHLHGS